MLTPTPVDGSQPVKHQVVNKRPTKVLSAGLRSVPQASWHGARVGPEPHVNWPLPLAGNTRSCNAIHIVTENIVNG